MLLTHKRWLNAIIYGLLGIFSLYFLLWVSSPWLAHSAANKALTPLGLSLSRDSHIRYLPFTSEISLQNITLLHGGQRVAALAKADVEIDLHRLLFRELVIARFDLTGLYLNLRVQQGQVTVAGVTLDSNAAAGTPGKGATPAATPDFTVLAKQLRIRDSEVDFHYEEDLQQISVKQLRLRELFANAQRQSLSVDLEAGLLGGQLRVQQELTQQSGHTELKGTVQAQDWQLAKLAHYTAAHLAELQGQFSLDLSNRIIAGQDHLQLALSHSEIRLQKLSATPSPYRGELNNFALNIDELLLNQGGDNETLQAQARLSANQVHLGLRDGNDTLASLLELTLADIAVATTPSQWQEFSLNIGTLALHELMLSRPEHADAALLRLGQGEAQGIKITPQALALDSVHLSGIDSAIHIDSDKRLKTLVALPARPAADEMASTDNTTADNSVVLDAEKASPKHPQIRIGTVLIDGENRVSVQDASIKPALKRELFIKRFLISAIDSTTDVASPFELAAVGSDHTAIAMAGTVTPFTEQVNLTLQGDIRELALHDLSAYASEALGFDIKSGQLDTHLDVQVRQSQLDGKVRFLMRGADMSAAQVTQTHNLASHTAIPLNVALGMLKDKNGNIKLEVPLDGSVEDPEFGLNSLILLVTKKAVLSQARSYLLQTLTPYATVVSVAINAGEYALKLRFEDLLYTPGQVVVAEPQAQYLQQFIALMQDKPDTQVKLCASATPADLGAELSGEAIDEANLDHLQQIARERATQFKDAAVAGGIASSRLLLCKPEVDLRPKAQPHLSIAI